MGTDYSNFEEAEVQETGIKDRMWFAIASFVIGLLCLCAWFLPICGVPASVTGIILGVVGLDSSQRGLAIAGIVLSALGFTASIINAVLGVVLELQDFAF
ncbi:MAG: hypothetical protein GTO18_07110 [Anaerolineales bacterium]|nr:hypothetical protein [Anaerolineales bacterium]